MTLEKEEKILETASVFQGRTGSVWVKIHSNWRNEKTDGKQEKSETEWLHIRGVKEKARES